MTRSWAAKTAMEYCRDTLGRVVRAKGVLEDPQVKDSYWVAVEDVNNKDMWTLLVEYGMVTEDSLTLSVFIRNGGKLDYVREPKQL